LKQACTVVFFFLLGVFPLSDGLGAYGFGVVLDIKLKWNWNWECGSS